MRRQKRAAGLPLVYRRLRVFGHARARGGTVEWRKENGMSDQEEQKKTGGAPEPSGPKGNNPATAGPGPTKVVSTTPENDKGEINPSAPEDSNTTPGSTPQAIE